MTTSNFHLFKDAVNRQFNVMKNHDMFRTTVEKDDLWNTYLESFPDGTNPIFRQRREYDCSCCRQFIRAVGDVVAIIDDKMVSIWDCPINDPAYKTVANAMSNLVKSKPIENKFLHTEKYAGTDCTYEHYQNRVLTWNHFFVSIPYASNIGRNFYCSGKNIGPILSESKALHDVLFRSLSELTMYSIDTVLELISQNSLYRGQEHQFAVSNFKKMKKRYDALLRGHDEFVWSNIGSYPPSVVKIRNTSIGTLLADLSSGIDLEEAVRKFEAMVAPQNYKRPTALVTQGMVDAAKKEVELLGLTSALERRYAALTDISVNNVIFVNNFSRRLMREDIFSSIATKSSTPKKSSKAEGMTIEEFIENVVPNIDSIEIMMENSNVNNLVSLIAPVDNNAKPLFKWNNNFSWSYNGEVTDSIKERVKKAGGNVTGDLCCRLSWHNFDDLDFHMKEPGDYEIYYPNKGHISPNGGILDVDMNAGSGITREPVENIFYKDRRKMREGVYNLSVHQFFKRESGNTGFEVEIDYMGNVISFTYDRAIPQGGKILIAEFEHTHSNGLKMIESLTPSFATKTIWGIKTGEFHQVNVFMLSPNRWDNQLGGNKHYFFMLDGCVNDGQARGFYNEFLRSELDKHRKTLEIVGSKTKVQASVNQLSGLGFSDTKPAEILVRVSGKITRTLKVFV